MKSRASYGHIGNLGSGEKDAGSLIRYRFSQPTGLVAQHENLCSLSSGLDPGWQGQQSASQGRHWIPQPTYCQGQNSFSGTKMNSLNKTPEGWGKVLLSTKATSY